MADKRTNPYEEQTTVFYSRKENKEVYRIPALFYDKERNLLMAFAERRLTSDDASGEELVVKTAELLRDEDTQKVHTKWSEVRTVVDKAGLNGYRPMNPCPVYERSTKTLFLVFICVEGTVSESWQRFWGINKARLCYVTTADGGHTWSQVTYLTDQLPAARRWATFAVGPGHGLQTASGRLMVSAYAYGSCSHSCFCICCFCATPRALSIYSDDDGATWRSGKELEHLSIECEMAEITDGAGNMYVYCNARSRGGYRVEALSDDGGDDFVLLPPAEKLVETGSGCQGSVVSFPAQAEGANATEEPRWLLYAHPTSKKQRTDLGIYLNRSPKDPNSWSAPWVINEGPSGYSDLAYIGGGRFACLMERGVESEIEQIACNIFSYRQVVKSVGQ